MSNPIPPDLDLSDYIIGPDGVGVTIFWSEDRIAANIIIELLNYSQYLTFQGKTTNIGFYSEWFSTYDGSYGVTDAGKYDLILTNGSDRVDGGYRWPHSVYGLGGDDVLIATTFLDGGDGNDTLTAASTMIGGAGDDVLRGPGVMIGGDGNDRLSGGIGAQTLDGGSGVDVLNGDGDNDVLTGGSGADRIDGGDGIDRADYLGSAAGVTVNLATNANSGGDAVGDVLTGIETVGGSDFADSLTGDAGANKLWGRAGNDVLAGGAGDDSLYGEAGADTLQGGDGQDWLIGGAGGDVLNGGGGTDTANYAEATGAVALSLLDGAGTGGDAAGDGFVSVENVLGSAFGDQIKGDAGANGLWGMAGADRLYGAGGNDALSGGDNDDALYGEAGADTLTGGEGNDSLTGGAGADALSGGNGIDIALYDSATGAVTVNLATGAGTAGDAAGDTYNSIENVLGSAYNDTTTGNAGANAFWGMAGNDVLTGGGGADALKGGAGADRFVYQAVSDSTASARDGINDFSHADGDRIDLSAIDADGNAGNGNTAFTFLGTGAFTGAGHELRVTVSGGVQIVLADLNGDKVADMALGVVSATTLVAGDFVL